MSEVSYSSSELDSECSKASWLYNDLEGNDDNIFDHCHMKDQSLENMDGNATKNAYQMDGEAPKKNQE